MYGMVQLGMEAMVTQQHDHDTWVRITERAGHPDLVTVSNEPYPDELTYALVGAACEALGADPAELLHAFGRYWVAQFAQDHYRTCWTRRGTICPRSCATSTTCTSASDCWFRATGRRGSR